MKLFQVVEALIPIANEIYSKESLDLVEVDNPSNRVICAPGDFILGEVLTQEEFSYENRAYQDHDGSNEVSGVFAVKNRDNTSFTQDYYEAGQRVLHFIRKALATRDEFIFESEPLGEDGYVKDSVYDDLPRGVEVGKYGIYSEFAILSVKRDGEHYTYTGLGIGDNSGNMFTGDLYELQESGMAQIADNINKVLKYKK
jgi:hypothetical protein